MISRFEISTALARERDSGVRPFSFPCPGCTYRYVKFRLEKCPSGLSFIR